LNNKLNIGKILLNKIILRSRQRIKFSTNDEEMLITKMLEEAFWTRRFWNYNEKCLYLFYHRSSAWFTQ